MEPKQEQFKEEEESLGRVGWGVKPGDGGAGLWRAQGGLEVEACGGDMQGISSIWWGGGAVQTAGSLFERQNHRELYKVFRCSAHLEIQTQWSEHLSL